MFLNIRDAIMATFELEVGKHWRKAILLRLAQLELKVTEIPMSHTKSTFVISYNTTTEKKNAQLILAEIAETKRQMAEERRQKAIWVKKQEARDKLNNINLFRRLTFRKPLNELPA